MSDDRTAFVLSDTRFPFVHTVFPVEATTAFIESYFGQLTTLAARGPFVQVVDIRPVNVKTAKADIRNAFFTASDTFDNGPGKGVYLGEAVVLNSALQRALLSAYFWFNAGAAYPTKAFTAEDDAWRWIESVWAERRRRG